MSDLLIGRTVLITGATNGHGLALARQLAADGATVVLHGRTPEKALAAETAVLDSVPGAVTHTIAADLADLRAVEALAAEVKGRFPELHVLVNNAGIGSGRPGQDRELSPDGIELRFAVNYLAGVVLTRALLPRLTSSPRPRIINVASLGQAPIDPNDPMLERSYNGGRAYAQSKLAQIMFTIDLADQLGGAATVNAVHPATYMPTGMVKEAGVTPWSSIEDGVRATAWLVEDPALDSTTGKFFDGQREAEADETAYAPAAREYLRALTDRLLLDALGSPGA
jgi:NAD(P)-dependent dehydrogenase (short-subunit alcohol dehydrogenase family)